jgi:hypothetical protein
MNWRSVPRAASCPCETIALADKPNTVRNKIAEFLRNTLECASHAGALGSEAMLPTLGVRSMASHKKSGSTAPAVQGVAASSPIVGRKNPGQYWDKPPVARCNEASMPKGMGKLFAQDVQDVWQKES